VVGSAEQLELNALLNSFVYFSHFQLTFLLVLLPTAQEKLPGTLKAGIGRHFVKKIAIDLPGE